MFDCASKRRSITLCETRKHLNLNDIAADKNKSVQEPLREPLATSLRSDKTIAIIRRTQVSATYVTTSEAPLWKILSSWEEQGGIREDVGVQHTEGRTSPPALHHQSTSKPRAFLAPGGHQPFCLLFHWYRFLLWLLQPSLTTEHTWLLMFRGWLSAHHRSQILIICISCIFQMPWENRNVERTTGAQPFPHVVNN